MILRARQILTTSSSCSAGHAAHTNASEAGSPPLPSDALSTVGEAKACESELSVPIGWVIEPLLLSPEAAEVARRRLDRFLVGI
mmetsp:Transcript_15097/g.32533  ORF Transcript_15097/g.32533 Transcript_15097/m.32533 type:complete len:84 (-) Transcript_15097:71-322(-)